MQNANTNKLFFQPGENFEFPFRIQHGCFRALNYHWLKKFQFVDNSTKFDSVFRLPCTLFDKFSKKGKIINKPAFSSQYKVNEQILKHIDQESNDDPVIGIYSKMMRKAKVLKQSSAILQTLSM